MEGAAAAVCACRCSVTVPVPVVMALGGGAATLTVLGSCLTTAAIPLWPTVNKREAFNRLFQQWKERKEEARLCDLAWIEHGEEVQNILRQTL